MSVADSASPHPGRLDLICVGRAAVDLYGEQIGSRLEDVTSFAKHLGGSPANTAVGASRLGLNVGMLSRVGDEHNGRFVREQLARERVDVSQLHTDPKRLTALAFLGIKDRETFPLLFYREQCADMGLCAADVDPAYVATARALLISGTHLSRPQTHEACVRAMRAARAAGTRVVLDVDDRPVPGSPTSLGLGERHFVASDPFSMALQEVLPLCDLVVGTEEEVHIAGGAAESLVALQRIRDLTPALVVMRRGPMGCTAFPGSIPAHIDDGIQGPGFPVEVFNVLGAGDAFMAGLLRGWIRKLPLIDALRYANACSSIVVSRHGCAPAMPSWIELSHFLLQGSRPRRLRDDADLEHLHRATTRTEAWPSLAVLAFDHRSQFEELADRQGVAREHIAQFKRLVARAAMEGHAAERAECADGVESGVLPAAGVIVDGRYGEEVLMHLTGIGCWIGRPVEVPGSRPLAFEDGANVGLALRTWPAEHVIKCLLSHHPDDDESLASTQLTRVAALAQACHGSGHEFLLELIPPRSLPADSSTLSRAMAQVYATGIRPDWWKLPPPSEQAWPMVAAVINANDPHCRGVLLLGLDASEAALKEGFEAAAGQAWCKGFAVGRSIFGNAAAAWFGGSLDDAGAMADVANRYRRLIRIWREVRGAGGRRARQQGDPLTEICA